MVERGVDKIWRSAFRGALGRRHGLRCPRPLEEKESGKSYSLVVFERVVWAVEVVEGLEQNFDCV